MTEHTSHEVKRPTLLVMAGGTGGHIFPGIAVAEALVQQGWNIHWLGTAERMEAELVPKNGYPISFINIAGIRNKNWQTWLKTPFKILQSVWQSIRVLREVAIENVMPAQPATSKKVLVVGGSLGAKILNDVVPQAMKQIKVQSIDVWHQTGGGNEQTVLKSYQDYGLPEEKVKVTEFIDDMAAAYQWADVVICRAGALTVSELAMAAKPAIFVPLPHAVDDHQTKNAMYLVNCGAAKLIAQKEFNGTTLGQMLNSLFISDKVVQQMSKAAHNAAHADATKRVANVCIEVAQQRVEK